MANEEHFRKLERTYLSAPTNAYYRPAIRVGEGWAEITLPIRPEHHHSAHAAHGSLYFKALDDAAFFAVNSIVEDVFVLTASFNLNLLRPIAAGEMRARGTLVHRSLRLFLAESEIKDELGRLLARGSGTFVRSTIPLRPEIGYR